MRAKTANHNHNLYTLHYSPKLTDFLLADSNVHAISSQPNTSHHSHQQVHGIGNTFTTQTGYCGQKLEYFFSRVEDKIKKGVENFISSIPQQKMSMKLEQSIETLLLSMLSISKQFKLFKHSSPQSSHEVPLQAPHLKYHNPQSHMLIQQGDDLPILSQYPSFEQYQQEPNSMSIGSSISRKASDRKSTKKGYKDIHQLKQQIKKGSNPFMHQGYADSSRFDSDSQHSQQEQSTSDKQTQSEIGTQDHPFTTSVLPKSYARTSHYHTTDFKQVPRQLITREQNLSKQIKFQKQAKVQESISEYYLESSYGSKMDKENQRPSININQFNSEMRGPTIQSTPPQTCLYSQVVSRKRIF